MLLLCMRYQTSMGEHASLDHLFKYSLQILSTKSAIFGLIRRIWSDHKFEKGNFVQYTVTDDLEDIFHSRLEVFVAICKAFQIEPILMTQPIASSVKTDLTPQWIDEEAQEKFNNRIRAVSKAHNVNLVDLAQHINETVLKLPDSETQQSELQKIFYDGMHVTDYGSIMYADFISEKLLNIITQENL